MPEGDCYKGDFDIACPGDTHFYQACGHGGCAGYEVGGKLQKTPSCAIRLKSSTKFVNRGFVKFGNMLQFGILVNFDFSQKI